MTQTTNRFENAVQKLVQAFFNDNLEPNECDACAVGNICDNSKEWVFVFLTPKSILKQSITIENYYNLPQVKETIDKTGYGPLELAKVEYTFECACANYLENTDSDHYSEKEEQFQGLCAVVDTLLWLDGINEEVGEDVKSTLKQKLEPET